MAAYAVFQSKLKIILIATIHQTGKKIILRILFLQLVLMKDR